MSVTYGFYNSVNHDRKYDALQFGSIFDGIIRDGIYETIGDCFIVKESEGLTVTVGEGRAWFNHTWILNDSLYPLTWEGDFMPELILDRIDLVIIETNVRNEVRANTIKIIKGTPSTSPVEPTLLHDDKVHQYKLAAIRINAGITEIKQSMIKNYVGTTSTPFVIGALEILSIDSLLAQWEAGYTESIDRDTAAYAAWFRSKRDEVITWFENLQVVMDGDVAMHLQNEIDNIVPISDDKLDDILGV